MKFIALKTNDGQNTGKIAFYCKLLHVSRQGFYKYLKAQTRPWKYQDLADAWRSLQKTNATILTVESACTRLYV